jgi:Zn-dependent protease with chaperone function
MQSFLLPSTYEINIHLIVFLLVIFSITGVMFPVFVLYWITFAIINITISFGWLDSKISESFSASWTLFAIVGCILLFIIYTVRIINSRKNNLTIHDRKLFAFPTTEKGRLMITKLSDIWSKSNLKNRPIPEIKWFVNFNVLARAVDNKTNQRIEVSSSLWERVTVNDPIGEIILTHEVAHLVFKDIPIFLLLDHTVKVVCQIIRFILRLSVITLLYVVFYEIYIDFKNDVANKIVLLHLIGVPFVYVLVVAPLLMGEIVIRRYAGFIGSMMELRADIYAAEKCSGLTNFMSLFKHDDSVHKSTKADLRYSLVSLNLTHISESERMTLLANSDRLSTPKIRYFALSVLLVILIPINSFTPLLWTGALDLFFITAVVSALYMTAYLTLICRPAEVALTFKRSLVLATTLFFVNGLIFINLYSIGYLLTTISASFFSPNGFAQNFITWLELQEYLSLTCNDIIGQLGKAYIKWETVPIIILSSFCIYLTANIASRYRFSRVYILSTSLILLYIVTLCCYDGYRGTWYKNFLFSPAKFLYDCTEGHWGVRYILPIMFATLAVLAGTKFAKKSKMQ